MRTVIIKVANIIPTRILNFTPGQYFINKNHSTGHYQIGCHFIFGDNLQYRGRIILACLPEDYSKTHKIIGLNKDLTYIQLRKN